MGVNKKMLIFVSVVASVTTGIMLYYAGEQEEVKDEQVLVRERNIEKHEDEVRESYIVCLEGNYVVLYRLKNDEKTPVDKTEIDTEYYPGEDIKALSEGISAYTIEEGYKILENFVNWKKFQKSLEKNGIKEYN